MTKLSNLLFIFCMCFSIVSCLTPEESWQEEGQAPIYVSPEDFSQVYATSPRQPVNQGKIEEVNGLIYINELFKGIHVIDNQDPGNAKAIYFYRIPGNSEFQVNGDYIYADNSRHLLTIDISRTDSIYVTSYLADQYSVDLGNNNFPSADYVGRFECVDFEKGIVTSWEQKLLDSPKCFM